MSWLKQEVARIERQQNKKRRRKIYIVIAVVLCIVVVMGAALILLPYAEERKTAVIRVEGTMVTGNVAGGGYIGSEYVGRELRNAADDPLVEAIVLRVNSPGGTPSAAQEIIRDIEYAKLRKPVVVSMGDVAASAAYHISTHADWIYANPDTITGSIGASWTFYDYSRFLDIEGIGVDVVKSGEKKDMTSSFRSLSEEEREYAQEVVNASFEAFIRDVVEQRGVSRELIEDARVFRGDEALDIGLIDELGNLYDAIDGAQKIVADQFSSMPSSADQPS